MLFKICCVHLLVQQIKVLDTSRVVYFVLLDDQVVLEQVEKLYGLNCSDFCR